MVGFANMHDVLFRHFGVTGQLIDKESYTPTSTVDAVLDFGVEDLDEYNEVVGRLDKVSIKSTQEIPTRGQILVVETGEFAGRYVIGRKLRSNGYIQSFEISRAADA